VTFGKPYPNPIVDHPFARVGAHGLRGDAGKGVDGLSPPKLGKSRLGMDDSPFWTRARDLIRSHSPELRFCLRMTVAALMALTIVQSLALPLHGLWTVLTAVVVTQLSVGGSLRATIEYVVGTLGGAVYAGAMGALIPHTTAIAQDFVLALTIAPLALAAAINPNFRVAPFSAVLVVLLSGQLGQSPVESALNRFLEVALGGAVAVFVSVLVFPERAHGLARGAAAQILRKMAEVLAKLLSGFTRNLDTAAIADLQGGLGRSVTACQAIATEAKRERMVPFAREPDPAALSRTLLRLRHDLVILGRAAAIPLPDAFAERLGPPLARVSAEASEFLLSSAAAVAQRRSPPPLEPADASISAYESEVALLRSEGLTRALSTGEVERLFALGFALEQLRQNFGDLARCLQELARSAEGKSMS
jgi:uncharacterized membrane protein YccC